MAPSVRRTFVRRWARASMPSSSTWRRNC